VGLVIARTFLDRNVCELWLRAEVSNELVNILTSARKEDVYPLKRQQDCALQLKFLAERKEFLLSLFQTVQGDKLVRGDIDIRS